VISADLSCSIAAFVVNSEPHTGERPSACLCAGLKKVDPVLIPVGKTQGLIKIKYHIIKKKLNVVFDLFLKLLWNTF
jgi:hypothetical protein